MKKKHLFLSVNVCIHNSADQLATFTKSLVTLCEAQFEHYEILFVDNASTDHTEEVIDTILQKYDCIRYLRLPFKHKREIVFNSGLENALGDYIVTLSLQSDPIEIIPELVDKVSKDGKAIFGVRKGRPFSSLFSRTGASLFHWYTKKILEIDVPERTTDLFVFSRKHLSAYLKIKGITRYPILLKAYTGFAWTTYSYKEKELASTSRKKFLEDTRKAIDIIISNSLHPLRTMSVISICAGLLNLFYISYVILTFLFKKNVIEGWTTLSFQISVMFFFLFMALAVISEYVGRVLRESQNRPQYFITEEKNSSVLLSSPEKRNISKQTH